MNIEYYFMLAVLVLCFCVMLLVMTALLVTIRQSRKQPPAELSVEQLAESVAVAPMERQWAKAMNSHYSKKWEKVFESMEYPPSDENLSQIALLSWEVASRTMAFCRVSAKDPNQLKRDTLSVKSVINDQPQPTEPFRYDPQHVSRKAVAVYDYLRQNKVSGRTEAFDYMLDLTQ